MGIWMARERENQIVYIGFKCKIVCDFENNALALQFEPNFIHREYVYFSFFSVLFWDT